MPKPLSTLIELFFLRKTVFDAEDVLGTELLGILLETGILRREKDGGFSAQGRYILPFQGVYLLAEAWKPGEIRHAEQVWLGKDSMLLSRMIPPLYGRTVLDLGSGTGLLTLLAILRGGKTTAVDISPRAVEFTHWNLSLNGMNAEVLLGDLFEPVHGRSFDHILINAPFTPLASKRSHLFQAGGGSRERHGLGVLYRTLENLHLHLNPGGSAYIVCGGFGDEERPAICDFLEEVTARNRWRTQMFLTEKMPSADRIQYMKQFSTADDRDLEPAENRLPHSHYYSYFIVIHRDGQQSRFTLASKLYRQFALL